MKSNFNALSGAVLLTLGILLSAMASVIVSVWFGLLNIAFGLSSFLLSGNYSLESLINELKFQFAFPIILVFLVVMGLVYLTMKAWFALKTPTLVGTIYFMLAGVVALYLSLALSLSFGFLTSTIVFSVAAALPAIAVAGLAGPLGIGFIVSAVLHQFIVLFATGAGLFLFFFAFLASVGFERVVEPAFE